MSAKYDNWYPDSDVIADANDLPAERCALCRFYKLAFTAQSHGERLNGDDPEFLWPTSTGDCRRFPPTINIQSSLNMPHFDVVDSTSFPAVEGDDWCGEFRPIQPTPLDPASPLPDDPG